MSQFQKGLPIFIIWAFAMVLFFGKYALYAAVIVWALLFR